MFLLVIRPVAYIVLFLKSRVVKNTGKTVHVARFGTVPEGVTRTHILPLTLFIVEK